MKLKDKENKIRIKNYSKDESHWFKKKNEGVIKASHNVQLWNPGKTKTLSVYVKKWLHCSHRYILGHEQSWKSLEKKMGIPGQKY